MKTTKTESRKKDHVELVVKKGAQYDKTTGLERFEFIHNALPEISLEEVNLATTFLGKAVKWPILISGMTGGYPDAERINKDLAKTAEKYGFALGLGSQRAMIEKPELAKTYAVRALAPNVPLLANIGAAQLKKYSIRQIEGMINAVDADGLAIHLNPLQEAIQPEGDTDFSGVLSKITEACSNINVPVVVKETGAGINQDVALKLKDAGVRYLDVSGAGGTSWSKVEYLRGGHVSGFGLSVSGFENWGLPTSECIIQCRGVLPMIASGGISNGIDGAKTIAFGADMCGAAYPFLKALYEKKLDAKALEFTMQMKICAFLTGSKTIADLKKAKLIFK